MSDFLCQSVYFGAVISILAYFLGTLLQKRFKLLIFNPLFISTLLVITALIFLHVDYDGYYQGAKYITYLLTPTTVCLAIPLYRQINLLKKNPAAILLGIGAGVLSALGSIFVMSYLFGLSHGMYVSILPKSITTAIGMPLAEEFGGSPTIASVAIFFTGMFGNMTVQWLCKLFRIKHPVAVGLSFGSSCHAMGTSKAFEIGEAEGAMSSLAIVVTGLLTVIAAQFFVNLI